MSNFWKGCDLPLINCEADVKVTWLEKCIILSDAAASFQITEKKLNLLVIILPYKDNAKLLH